VVGRDGTRSYVVECYWPGVSDQRVNALVERVQAATRTSQLRGAEIEFIETILVRADETVFCLFDGCESEVRAVSSRAEVPFERVLESRRFGARRELAR
jgi:hypothetical protein